MYSPGDIVSEAFIGSHSNIDGNYPVLIDGNIVGYISFEYLKGRLKKRIQKKKHKGESVKIYELICISKKGNMHILFLNIIKPDSLNFFIMVKK